MTPGSVTAARPPELEGKAVVDGARTAILVGNPNVGKSVVFGALTGKYVTVSNYPGTTVEVTRGSATLRGRAWHVMDTPGTNNLLPMSEDEQVTRDILLRERDYVCIQVCDAKNLRRGLLLSLQLSEAGVPFLLALNMADEAAGRGFRIDAARLASALGVQVVSTVAVQRQGLATLADGVADARVSSFRVRYDEAIERAVAEVEPLLPVQGGLSRRAVALMALVGDGSLRGHLAGHLGPEALARIDELCRRLAAQYPESLRFVLARQRLAAVDRLHDEVVARDATGGGGAVGRFLAAWATHPIAGVPFLLLVLFACYQFVGVLGAGVAVEFLEQTIFNDHLVPWVEGALRAITPDGKIEQLLVGPPGVPFREHGGLIIGKYGLVSMGLSYGLAIVLPIVATFFVAFSVLEDSGYLPRLAVMVNRLFKWMGLNGKAVLPMVLGLGCDTMATMTARIMETRKERVIVTLLLALGVPCSAQLAVIFAMLAGVGPGAALWFAGTVVMVLFLVGWLAARVIPGRGSDFILELPPLRRPQLGNIAVKTLARVEWYLREALPLFVLGTAVLYLLDLVGGIDFLERVASPVVVDLLQLPKEATGAFILGFLRRDYAAAGLFVHYQPFLEAGTITKAMEIEIVVALVVITLFIPCIANFFMIVKERGLKTGVAIMGFIMPFAVGVGTVVNLLMRRLY
jgi:ferrous iron transport protein B